MVTSLAACRDVSNADTGEVLSSLATESGPYMKG